MSVVWSALSSFLHAQNLLGLLIGTFAGVVVGLAPGLSSRSALLIAIPFMLGLDPATGAIVLIALHSASHISGTVPAALLGIPTSASEAAAVADGYPMTARGEAARAFGAIIASNALGGLIGAVGLISAGPIAAALIVRIGSPEIAALAVGGLLAIAVVSNAGLASGLAMGMCGVLVSTVGVHPATGFPRFAFGQDSLYGGLSAPAIIAGVMAMPELLRRVSPVAQAFPPRSLGYIAVLKGMGEPFAKLAVTARAVVVGLIVGLTPGLGSSVAAWVAYGQARQTSRSSLPFGSGAIEGIIAPEAASGSKEGGALIPTLFLGIPGSSGMAILLVAFAIIGVPVGPGIFAHHSEFPVLAGISLASAQILGVVMALLAAPVLLKLVRLPRRAVAIASVVGATLATLVATPGFWPTVELIGFTAFGVWWARGGLARPAFLIGFIIGPILESALIRTSSVYGWAALARPGVWLILGLIALAAIYVWRSGLRAGDPAHDFHSERRGPLGTMFLLCLVAAGLAISFPAPGQLMPLTAAGIGAGASLLGLLQSLRASPPTSPWTIDPSVSVACALATVSSLFIGPIMLTLPLGLLILPTIRRLGGRNLRDRVGKS